jgi:hypothetical protein
MESKADKIFIGHGRSLVWFELKEFLTNRLHLHCDEFNADSVAGRSTIDRLGELLGRAWFAFLVMTGDDLHDDGAAHARENVIHEAGLFQGRLGFERAIILLEDGCAEFSNIHGLTTIRFPKENIAPAFEEIRRALERETQKGSRAPQDLRTDIDAKISREEKEAEDYIPYMTEVEREIIGYLLAHNQKMFTNRPDCGNASTLLARGIVLIAARPEQPVTYFEVPFAIPDHIWTVLKRHQDKFPYEPAGPGVDNAHPWRRRWAAY